MKLIIKQKKKNEYVNTLRFNQVDEKTGKTVSTALICVRGMRFAGNFIPTMTIADVSTLPEYRNQGLVRAIFDEAHTRAREYGASVALLHPFSFDFYRKFGYEKVSDTVSATFSTKLLTPKCDLTPVSEKYYDKIIELFRDFSKNRNLMLDRFDISAFLRRKAETRILCDGDDIKGYITFEKDVENKKINVSEIVFRDENSLLHLTSYLGNFKEDFDTVVVSDVEPIPELYSFCNEVSDTYEARGDLAARILDTEALLLANEYPEEHGEFTMRVADALPAVAGVFKVVYEAKKCTVERLSDDTEADVKIDAPVLLRRIFGYDETPDTTNMSPRGCDFNRAFPKRINGLFEHF